jgi:hypothetical protein
VRLQFCVCCSRQFCGFVTFLIYTFLASSGRRCGWQRFGEIFPTNITDAKILALAYPLRLKRSTNTQEQLEH